MPKTVLRSGAPTTAAATPPAQPAPAEKTAAPATPPAATYDDAYFAGMRKRMFDVGLDEADAEAAIAKKRAELAGAPKTVATPPKAVATPPPAETPAPKAPANAHPELTDEEFANQLAAEDELPPEPTPAPKNLPATQTPAPSTAADAGHEEDSDSAAPVVRNHWSDASGGALTGPIDRSDFKTPQLKLIQGSGPLSKKFNQGTLVFLDQTLFSAPEPDKEGPPLNFIPVGINKYFRENLPRDPVTGKGPMDAAGNPVQPRNLSTIEEVQRAGGTTEFTVDKAGNRIKPNWGAAARCTLIVERPEGSDNPAFTVAVEIAGKVRYFAPAVMFVNGGQYRALVKPLIDATSFILCSGSGAERKIILNKRVWKMQVVKEKSGENMVFNPKVTMLPELTPPDLLEYSKSLLGS